MADMALSARSFSSVPKGSSICAAMASCAMKVYATNTANTGVKLPMLSTSPNGSAAQKKYTVRWIMTEYANGSGVETMRSHPPMTLDSSFRLRSNASVA